MVGISQLPAAKDQQNLDCLVNPLLESTDCCNPPEDYENPNHPCFLEGVNHGNLNKEYQNHCFLEDNGDSDGKITLINTRIINFYAINRYLGFACFSANKVLSIRNSVFANLFFPLGIFQIKNI